MKKKLEQLHLRERLQYGQKNLKNVELFKGKVV